MPSPSSPSLIPGATYLIHSKDENGEPWKGTARYVGPETSGGYPDGTLEFVCDDGLGGYFAPEEVQEMVCNLGGVDAELEALHKMAQQAGLHLAAAWIKARQLG